MDSRQAAKRGKQVFNRYFLIRFFRDAKFATLFDEVTHRLFGYRESDCQGLPGIDAERGLHAVFETVNIDGHRPGLLGYLTGWPIRIEIAALEPSGPMPRRVLSAT